MRAFDSALASEASLSTIPNLRERQQASNVCEHAARAFDVQLQAKRRLLPLDVHHRRHVLSLRREEGELHTQAGRRCAIALTKQSYRPTGNTLLRLEAATPYAVDRVEDDLLRLLAKKKGRVEWEGCRQMKKRG